MLRYLFTTDSTDHRTRHLPARSRADRCRHHGPGGHGSGHAREARGGPAVPGVCGMSRGPEPHEAIRQAMKNATARGNVMDRDLIREARLQFILFCAGLTVFVLIRRTRSHLCEPGRLCCGIPAGYPAPPQGAAERCHRPRALAPHSMGDLAVLPDP